MEMELQALREKRIRDFEAYMKKYPQTVDSGETYRDGKRRFYGKLLFALMGMCEDQDGFTQFIEKVLTNYDEAVQHQFYALDQTLKKVKGPELVKDIWLSAYGILGLCANFYIALGAYIGQNYQVVDPAAQEEIDDIGKLIVKEKVFSLVAKARVLAEISGSGGVIPARIESPGPGNAVQEKKKPTTHGGFLTTEQVAERVQVSEECIRRWARGNIIPRVRIGRLYRFSERQVDEWAMKHTDKGALKI